MENPKVQLVTLLSLLFLSLAVSDRLASYEMKRLVPSGPDQAESPDESPVIMKEHSFVTNNNNIGGSNFNHGIKRLVPTGPNSAQSPDPIPPIVKKSSFVSNANKGAGSFNGIKRLVPSGPNSAESPDPPAVVLKHSFGGSVINYEIRRLVPSGPNQAQSPDPVPLAGN